MSLLMKIDAQQRCLKDKSCIFLDLVKIIKKYRDLAIYVLQFISAGVLFRGESLK